MLDSELLLYSAFALLTAMLGQRIRRHFAEASFHLFSALLLPDAYIIVAAVHRLA